MLKELPSRAADDEFLLRLEVVEPMNVWGLERLAGAMLLQAMEDLHSPFIKYRTSAAHWIQDGSETQFSFVFCCRTVGRDPRAIRDSLLRDWMLEAGPGVTAGEKRAAYQSCTELISALSAF